MESNTERIVRYLQDAHAAEVGIESALEGFLSDTDEPEARQIFSQHREVTHNQALRIQRRLEQLGHEPSMGKGLMNTLMSSASSIMNTMHDEYDKVTQDLIKAFATEHFEIGMYTSLAAFAEGCGDAETAQLAREIMSEEQEAAEMIKPMIERCARATAVAR